MLVTSIFSFSHNVFNKASLSELLSRDLLVKGLIRNHE